MKTALLSCILAVMLFFPASLAADAVFVPFGEADIKLYVVALDGVNGHGVGNITRMVDGVLVASRVNATYVRLSSYPPLTLGEVRINTNATVIRDWDRYREVVETSSNAIIVNAHGEIIPVPADYTKETWVDKIADAMANRNVTWMHTAGYPFYYYHHQESGEGEWKEEGFQRVMSHIGKNNVTCYPHGLSENEKIRINTATEDSLLHSWMYQNAFFVGLGKPLYGLDWNNSVIMCIWGVDYGHMPGAVIKFGNQTHNFGFYIHIGTNQTYDFDQVPTDRDFYRGYIGTAVAVWACAWRFAAEDAISQAEAAIVMAEKEGRTKGLDEANQLLQRAKKCFETRETEHLVPYKALSGWGNAVLRAMEAGEAAEKAVKPSFLETYALPIAVLGVTGAAMPIALVIRWKRHSKKKKDEAR